MFKHNFDINPNERNSLLLIHNAINYSCWEQGINLYLINKLKFKIPDSAVHNSEMKNS